MQRWTNTLVDIYPGIVMVDFEEELLQTPGADLKRRPSCQSMDARIVNISSACDNGREAVF